MQSGKVVEESWDGDLTFDGQVEAVWFEKVP